MFITKDNPTSIGDYKREAKAQLTDRWKNVIYLNLIPIIAYIGYELISTQFTRTVENGDTTSFFVDLFVSTRGQSLVFDLLIYFFTTGVMFATVDFVTKRDYKIRPLEDALQIFKDYEVIYFIKVYLLQTLYTFLWFLLFIIPGLIKVLSYSQTELVYKDYKELGKELTANEAITISRQMMDGHKMELFLLELSFTGWYLLQLVTFGLSTIYSTPYLNTTKAVFYRKISLEYFEREGITREIVNESI